MNREIKFRIWFHKTKEWIHGPSDLPSCDGVNILGENILLGNVIKGISVEDLNDVEVVQYTGVDTKEGDGIFEGDFIQGQNYELPVQVVFENGGFGVKYSNRILYFSELDTAKGFNVKVVGNIFQNTELIK